MIDQIFSWGTLLSVVGVSGFHLAGKKIWWAWYINIACQVLWFIYAIVSEQYGFFVGSIVYSVVFIRNAIEWTKEHRAKNVPVVFDMPQYDAKISFDPKPFYEGVEKASKQIAAMGIPLKEVGKSLNPRSIVVDTTDYRKKTLSSPIVDILVKPPGAVFPESVVYLLTEDEQEILADLCTPIHDYLKGLI